MKKVFEQKLHKIKSNINRWYEYFGANVYINMINRKLYQYSGKSDRPSIRSIHAKAHECEVIENFSSWGSTLGLRSPNNAFCLNGNSSLMYKAQDLVQHFTMPVYHNLIGSLHTSVMGGLTKASIDVTVEKISTEYNKNFIKSQQKKILSKIENEQMQQALSKTFEEALNSMEEHDNDLNVMSSFLETNLQQFFNDPENKMALMSCLDNLFTMGFSALKLDIVKDVFNQTQIKIDRISQPERCFFSPLATKPDKSDGLFCGMIKVMDRKQIELMYEEELSTANIKVESLVNFTSSFFPFDEDYYFYSRNENYLVICQYFEKTKDGKIKMTICCDNFLFEEIILKEYSTLPIILLINSLSNEYQTSGTFDNAFSVQKMYNETEFKADKLIINTSTPQLLLPGTSVDNVAYEELKKGAYNDATILIYSPPAGSNTAFDPTVLPNKDVPQNVLVRCDQLVQRMQFIISGIMSNEITKGGESSGAISGISRAIGSLNHNNLFAKQLNVFTQNLNLLVQNYLLMFYRVFSKSKNPRYDILTMKNSEGKSLITEDIYKTLLSDLTVNIFFASDSSFNKEITRQSIIELMKVNDNPILKQILVSAYCSNLESSNQGDLLNAINEAQTIIAKQAQNPPSDPNLEIAMTNLRFTAEDKDKERQFKAQESDKDRHLDEWKKMMDTEAKILTEEMIRRENITSSQIEQAEKGASIISGVNK